MRVTPGGAQTRSKRSTAFPWLTPGFLTRGDGARVWDVDGHEYIDWICGLAAISLGYRFHQVDRAVEEQLRRGVSFSLPTIYEVEVGEQVCDALGAEQVRFVKTGSEATEGAMRIARLATGRDLIVSIGYHGWHSAHDAAARAHPGVPWGFAQHIIEARWGADLPPSYVAPVAAVLVEVCRDEPPPPGWLEGLRAWCDKHRALLVFDEIVTGFRWALRGATEYFGVRADLRCYGKGMANGFPLGCIVGPTRLMEHGAYVSGTFGGEALSLAACSATLAVYAREPVIKTMWAIGERLVTDFNALSSTLRGDLRLVGYPVHPRFVGSRRDAFLAAAAAEGVLFHPSGFNVSYSHTYDIVEETIEKCRRALARTP